MPLARLPCYAQRKKVTLTRGKNRSIKRYGSLSQAVYLGGKIRATPARQHELLPTQVRSSYQMLEVDLELVGKSL